MEKPQQWAKHMEMVICFQDFLLRCLMSQNMCSITQHRYFGKRTHAHAHTLTLSLPGTASLYECPKGQKQLTLPHRSLKVQH